MTSPRIERGAALLDQTAPGWTTKIDLDTLNLADTSLCVLGQVFDGYDYGLRKADLSYSAARRYGFDAAPNERYQSLTEKWRRYIAKRRAS